MTIQTAWRAEDARTARLCSQEQRPHLRNLQGCKNIWNSRLRNEQQWLLFVCFFNVVSVSQVKRGVRTFPLRWFSSAVMWPSALCKCLSNRQKQATGSGCVTLFARWRCVLTLRSLRAAEHFFFIIIPTRPWWPSVRLFKTIKAFNSRFGKQTQGQHSAAWISCEFPRTAPFYGRR